ncbi:MAG: hisD [Bacteroidota bacterium]|nr:hisD [Bacteroidota bacterium]
MFPSKKWFYKMQVIKFPTAVKLKDLLKRPSVSHALIQKQVLAVLKDIKENGDKALIKYTLQFDKVKVKGLRVSKSEIADAVKMTDKKLKAAIKVAHANISKFHKAQLVEAEKVETTKGVICWRENRPVENVGLYIPGGSAPLFSTILMLAIPAKIAGCRNVVLCTPPDASGKINDAILYTAQLCGVTHIYKAGGAQAIAAMACGTKTIAKVDKIFGPGNQYVTMAKQLVQQNGVAIDMPAGPSEVMVVADDSSVPAFVASDLLSQAEHGPDSQAILVTFSQQVIDKVLKELEIQLKRLPRKEVAAAALKNSKIILVKDRKAALEIVNEYAPEHLILAIKDDSSFLKKVVNAGSVFLGNYSPESAGDYASGTNHTLPTNGYARSYSGVSLDSFIKKMTVQKISEKGIRKLGWVIEEMAAAEYLFAHKNAVTVRLKQLKKK